MRQQQQGYFLILAVVFILVMGLMGTVIMFSLSNRANISVTQQNGLSAFYIAESGMEIGARLLTLPALTGTPARLSCASVTGTSSITNASLGSGSFTMTTINSSPIYATDSLSAAITSSATTIPVTSTAGFATSGRLLIDKENIDYAAISGNSFIGVTRGVGGSTASSHVTNASVGQYQCSLDVLSGIPTVAAATYQRELRENVQLQNGWAIGALNGTNFTLTHWNQPTEGAWTATNVAGGLNVANLTGISMVSYTDGWAVGETVGTNFIFLRWNGSAWTLNTRSGACSTQDLLDVSMVSSRDGWAVGIRYRPTACSAGNNRYTILRWTGSSWTLLTPTSSPSVPADNSNNQNLNAVHVIDTNGDGLSDIGFAVGNNGDILRFNGSAWVDQTSPTTRNLNGVYTVSSSEAWAVGTNGVILRWNGSTWSSYTSPTNSTLNDIAMLDTNGDGLADYGWIAANSERILSYDGTDWSQVDLGGSNLLAVSYNNYRDVWVAGSAGLMVHWDGTSWTEINSDTTRNLSGLSMVPVGQTSVSNWQQIFR